MLLFIMLTSLCTPPSRHPCNIGFIPLNLKILLKGKKKQLLPDNESAAFNNPFSSNECRIVKYYCDLDRIKTVISDITAKQQ